jgi:glycerol-3-phosphate dehydrogenase
VAMEQWVLEVAQRGGIGTESAHGIAEWYGKRALAVADVARGSAGMRAQLCPHTRHIVAEAAHAFNYECACTLADVLLRRVPVALGACWSSLCSQEAATRVAAVMAWSETRVAGELEAFERERDGFLQKASQAGTMVETKA